MGCRCCCCCWLDEDDAIFCGIEMPGVVEVGVVAVVVVVGVDDDSVAIGD